CRPGRDTSRRRDPAAPSSRAGRFLVARGDGRDVSRLRTLAAYIHVAGLARADAILDCRTRTSGPARHLRALCGIARTASLCRGGRSGRRLRTGPAAALRSAAPCAAVPPALAGRTDRDSLPPVAARYADLPAEIPARGLGPLCHPRRSRPPGPAVVAGPRGGHCRVGGRAHTAPARLLRNGPQGRMA